MEIKRVFLPIAAFVLFGLVSQSQAATTVYTDKAAWAAAVGAYSTEDFNDAILNPGVGIINSTLVPGSTYYGGTADSAVAPTYFTFSPNVFGFGGDWDLTGLGLLSSGIEVTINGSTEVVSEEIPNTMTGGFWGFVSDVAITDVGLHQGSQLGVSMTHYKLDNMVYSASPVPVPAAVWLFGSGLLGLLGIRRKKIT